jgi:hypothetical protein
MKKKNIIIIFLLLLLLPVCKNKTLPSEPPFPSETVTPGQVSTSTFTPTLENTLPPTVIMTSADTATCTETDTPTITETVTEQDTVTFTATFTMTATATYSPTPTATDSLPPYSFESELQGWSLDSTLGGYTGLSWNSDPTYAALSTTGSAQVTCNFVPTAGQGAIMIGFSNPQDLTGKTITGYVYVPEDLAALSNKYQIQIGIYTTAWQNSTATLLNTAGWMQISYVPSGVGESSVTAVRFWTKKNNASTPSWSGTIYFDEINWE